MFQRYDPIPQEIAGEARYQQDQRPISNETRHIMQTADQQLAMINALATACAPLPDLATALHRYVNDQARVYDALMKAIQAITATQQDDFEDTITLGDNIPAARVDYRGRRHLLVWSPATQTIIINKPGVGSIATQSLQPNWTVLDPPRGTLLSATGTPFTLVLRFTDHVPAGLV